MNSGLKCLIMVIAAFCAGFCSGHCTSLVSWIVPNAVMGILGFAIDMRKKEWGER